MRQTRINGSSAALIALALAAIVPATAKTGNAGLDRFKALAGAWEGVNASGTKVNVSYEVISGGTAVLERLTIGDHPGMVTVYYADGDRLMMTHYCGAGNQPRMAATSDSGKEIAFELVDVTGLESPDAGRMRRAVFEFPADGRLKTSWTWHEGGKDAYTEAFEVKRVPGEVPATDRARD